MEAQVVIAVIAAGVSVISVFVTGRMTSWAAIRTKRYELMQSKADQAAAILSRYREPLLNAAHDLQGRLFNIVKRGYLNSYLRCGEPDLEHYALRYTIYVVAQYICWGEIVRRDMRYLDLGNDPVNQEWVRLLEATQGALSYEDGSRPLRIFRGEQRAIGEVMMVPTPSGDPQAGRFEALGFAAFCQKLEVDVEFARWFSRLVADVHAIVDLDLAAQDRLVSLQNKLIDLIAFMDPDGARLPKQFRRKLDGSQLPAPNPV